MRAKKILKPKDLEEIYRQLREAPRAQRIAAIVNLIRETDNMYDFLEGFLLAKFPDEIWKKMAGKVIAEDKDEDTGRYISLDQWDRLELKRKPYEWFSNNYDDEERTTAFLVELTDDELNTVVDELINK